MLPLDINSLAMREPLLNTLSPDESFSVEKLKNTFDLLASRAPALALTSVAQRKRKLWALKDALLAHRLDIQSAMKADFGKNPTETDLSEILTVTSEIRYVCRHLSAWMAGERVATPLTLLGHRSGVMMQPKGVVLILSPWNFPINLTLIPLVSAIAAGNAVVLKPSEHTPHASAVMARIIQSVFDPNEVRLLEGGKDLAEALLRLPFNHIFFTGSPAVGKIVMAKAATHLASVTLELGGKSPAIVDETANLKLAANRIAWGKFMNAGQICISPDYVLVAADRMDDFLVELKAAILSLYGTDIYNNPDYARIINPAHYERLMHYIRQAASEGAVVAYGGTGDAATRFIAPTIITGMRKGDLLLEEEIFGPILPVIPYATPSDAVVFIQQRPKPLALYIFSKSRSQQDYFLHHTRSGGIAVNTTLVQFFNNALPFGGDNNSGIGKAHGYYGFLAFSNERAVIRQEFRRSLSDLVQPPYKPWLQLVAKWLTRWF